MPSDAFLLIFLVMIALITLFPAMLKRIGIPNVISLLVVGMIIGPNGLDLLRVLANGLSFLGAPPDEVYKNFNFFISALGSLGLVFLMALAGMEADFKLIKAALKPVIYLSILTFVVPATAGFFIYAYFLPDDFPGKLLFASLFASHSVGIVFPVIRDLKLTKTKFGAAVLISTVITDVASIIMLAVCVQMKRLADPAAQSHLESRGISIFNYLDPKIFGDYFTLCFLVIVILYMFFSLFIVSRLGRLIAKKMYTSDDALMTTFLLLIMITVLVGEFFGINLIVGAFIAGMGISSIIKKRQHGVSLFFKFEGIGYGLLIPFLFISIGMSTDFSKFAALGNLWIVLFTVVGLVGSKMLSGMLAMRLSGFKVKEGVCAGLMTIPQLSATLAAATIGREMQILNDNFFNAIVVLSIVTTLPVPSLVRYLIGRLNITFEPIEEEAYEIPENIDDDLI